MDLLPPPQRLERLPGGCSLAGSVEITLTGAQPGRLLAPARRLQSAVLRAGASRVTLAEGATHLPPEGATHLPPEGATHLPPATRMTLALEPVQGPQSYRLEVAGGAVRLVGHDPAGLFYGVCTLEQLLRLSTGDGATLLPGVRVEDWPDFRHRGVMLDVSRDRVPRMDFLLGWVDRLAGWKYNQLQLYMEHTFAYRGHERVWQAADPFTGEQIRQLDTFCRERHVELVPNQNSFGHMHRWLIHEPYRQLAECPQGVDHPFSPTREPFGLCPLDPGSLELLGDLYDQLLPHFSSGLFNVGLDETFDLGLGRSAEQVERAGSGRVYVDFLQAVHRLVTERGRRMQFWGDIILKHPELIRTLPRDAVALEWGYEADHPYERHAGQFAAAGLEFYVCPGTSSWNAIGGRVDNATENIARAAGCGKDAGASGVLVTDWGDNGHLQPPVVSLPGLVAGAIFSWKTGASRLSGEGATLLPRLLDVHAFGDRAGAMGEVLTQLGNAYLATGVPLRNGTILSRLMLDPGAWPPGRIPDALDRVGLERALEQVEQAAGRLGAARMDRDDAALIVDELRWVAEMLALACNVGIARLAVGLDRPLGEVDRATREPLARALAGLIQRQRELWLQRSRPGGLDDSAARLERTLTALQGRAETP